MASEFPKPSIDEADDLFDYDIDMQEAFRDANVAMSVSNLEPTGLSKSKNVDLGLGIDEEIKVTKKRRPVPKLDENRLRVSLVLRRWALVVDMISGCCLRPAYQNYVDLRRSASILKARGTRFITIHLVFAAAELNRGLVFKFGLFIERLPVLAR